MHPAGISQGKWLLLRNGSTHRSGANATVLVDWIDAVVLYALSGLSHAPLKGWTKPPPPAPSEPESDRPQGPPIDVQKLIRQLDASRKHR